MYQFVRPAKSSLLSSGCEKTIHSTRMYRQTTVGRKMLLRMMFQELCEAFSSQQTPEAAIVSLGEAQTLSVPDNCKLNSI